MPLFGLFVAVGLVGLAMGVPGLTGWQVHVISFPPLHADWDPRVGPGTLPSLVLAGLAVVHAGPLAARLSWWRLLGASYAAGLAWLLALALVDGPDGIGVILQSKYEYLGPARQVHDLGATLHDYIARIPFGAPLGHWPPHLAGHPPGALTFFVVLVRLGLGSGFAAGCVVIAIAATTALAVMVTLRLLDAEALARRAAPFLVLGPAAVWQAVSADAMFAAVGAWGMAALAAAAVRGRGVCAVGLALLAGALLGYCVMLSYGLPLLGLLALAVLVLARSWRPLPWAAGAALAVVLAYAAAGFSWWEALPVIRERYWAGVARHRPGTYWTWADLAALTVSAGPLLGSGLAVLVRQWRTRGPVDGLPPSETRVVRWLTGAGVAMVLVADASQMSKAEVERIWLPFVPWLLLSCGLLPLRWRRWGLAVQLVTALLVEHLLATGW